MRQGRSAALLISAVAIQISGTASAATAADFNDALQGHWVGTLEYRDYSNGGRVTLPTQLDIANAGDGSVDFRYVYDDGPGKTVRETSRVTVDPLHHRYVVADADERDVYRIVEQSGFGDAAAGRMLLAGKGKENHRPVVIRTSIVRHGNELTILRESQLPGEPFKFRHQYRFARATPAAP